jgi:cytochrome c
VNNSPNNTGRRELPPVQSPLIWYSSGRSPDFPLLGSGGRTACAGPLFHFEPRFLESGGFPDHFDGCLLIYDWQRPFLQWARLDADARQIGLEPFSAAARLARGRSDNSDRFQIKRPVDMCFGDDGCLYLADYGETWGVNADARLVKVSYQRGNLAPLARASGTGTEGREPLTVTLSAAGSRDPEGAALRYEWRFEPGGEIVATTSETTFTFRQPGNFTAELRAIDPEGAIGTAVVLIAVGNTRPTICFRSPLEGDFFTPGQPVAYRLDVSDAEDGSSADPVRAEEMGLRTLVAASWETPDGKGSETPSGFARMRQSDCFNCHAVEQRVVGPSLLEIADRYRGEPGALEATVGRVLKGSSGEWGPIPMLPHPQRTTDELHSMVSWIFSLEKGRTEPAMTRGLNGQVTAPNDPNAAAGVLEATYLDGGRSPIAPLPGKATVRLRPRRLEAEAADHLAGAAVVSAEGASRGKGVRASAPTAALRFSKLNLSSSGSVTCRVAGTGRDGKVELRAGTIEGECIARLEVNPAEVAQGWSEISAPLKTSGSRGDILVVLVGAGSGGRLNLDWVQFNER